MVPIISIVGKSDVGKTTFIERLIPELKHRGYRVATVKHNVHGFEIDLEGKDSFRHRKSGASCVAISSERKLVLIREVEHEWTLDEICERFLYDMDLIITEGYKRKKKPKIEVYRRDVDPVPICTGDDNLIAMVSDDPVDTTVPIFRFSDIERITAFIEERFLKDRWWP